MKTTLAGQLHEFFSSACGVPNLDSLAGGEAWATICRVDMDDPEFLGVLRAVKAAIEKLIEQFKSDPNINKKAKENYLNHLNHLREITHPSNLVSNWRDVKTKYLSKERLELLTFLDDAQSQRYQTAVLENDDADQLIKEFSNVFEQIGKSKLDEVTKQWI
ncbi:MAG: hypothetical protein IIA01_01170, partial [Proteobacteria bacterium]|nr:hypothetical protein [Pseudomonadota bacterium]